MVRLGLVVALIALWAPAAHGFERARPMGLYAANNGPALAMLDSRIDVTVRGPIVETVVVQRFRNTGDRPTEATYIFPLPADAAVSAMAMQIGAVAIRAAIERRDDAQRRYEAAVAAGAAAALLDQERPDVFTQTVSAIPPRGVVEVTLRYDTVARYQSGTWELVVPMVVAPRYVPGTASGRATTGSGRAPDTDRAPDASRVTPAGAPGAGGATAIAIHFVDEPTELTSPTHELGGTRSDATLSDPHSDHDAIVRWRAPAPAAGWLERDGDGGVAAVVVEAPPAAPPSTPLRVILAIDRAATTRGDAGTVEHPLVRALFAALDRADRVRVIGSDEFAWSTPATNRDAVERAWASASGSFDLTRVLETARPEGAPIVLVTDGLVADDPAAIAAARALGVPIHAIGIGPAPARATLQQLAAATGGTVRFAVAGDDLVALARAVLADVATPPAPLKVTWGTLVASEVEPAVLPRLGAGQAMLVLARVNRVQAANARARGELFAFEALAPARAVDGATTTHGPLARRWARERLGDLLAGKHDRNAVTSLALRHGLVSPYTSLVAIGSEVIVKGGVKHSVAVPVSMPLGMRWQAVKQAIEIDTSRDAAPDARRDRARKPAPPEPAAKEETSRKTRRSPAKPPSVPTDDAPHRAGKAEPAPTQTAPPLDQQEADEARGEQIIIQGRAPTIPSQNNAPSPVSAVDVKKLAEAKPESAADSEDVGRGEAITLVGGYRSGRALRLTAALGGGVAFDHGGRGLLSLDARLETNRRTSLGGEASLWLVDGVHPEGRALLTVARSGLARWFELGFGAGVHFGNGTGVASSLRLHVDTPLFWLGGYLRYDAAVLLTRPSIEAEHAVTLGLELTY